MGYVYGTQWTSELIKKEIIKVMNALDINRMPSSVEIKRITGNSKLINAIRRNNGFNYWASKLGLLQSKCETRTGFASEIKVKKILEDKGYKVEKMTTKHPYDLLVNDSVKIDVKSSNKYLSSAGWNSYSFNLEKINPTCDIYIIYCIQDEKLLIIPSKFLKQTQLCITDKTSKYDIYKDRWDYIEQYNSFYKTVI
ncbi:hypothetical protein FDA48_11700 [Clostridium botulinum]|nr:hypothetical protein [Clostridium botulinum]